MIYASVCSGIAAEAVAWKALGWKCAFHAEIDPFPNAVLKHHYPEVPNLGDFTKITAEQAVGLDLLFGGTPCQDFSVAGLRKGVAGDRGNLTLEFLRLVDRARPLWVVWENVFGVLSSTSDQLGDPPPDPVDVERDGQVLVTDRSGEELHAFNCFLAGLSELGYRWAYRLLDAQFAGVPQRRRRVFVVGHLRDWRRPAAVLFDRASLCGDPPPSRAARTEVAGPLGAGSPGSGWRDDLDRAGAFVAGALRGSDGRRAGSAADETQARNLIAYSGTSEVDSAAALLAHRGQHIDLETETFVAHTLRGEGFDASEDGTGRGTPLVAHTVTTRPGGKDGGPAGLLGVIPIQSANRVRDRAQHGIGIGADGDPMFTLDSRSDHAIAFDLAQITHPENRVNPQPGDPAPPLAATGRPHVAFSVKDSGQDAGELSPTLRAAGGEHRNSGAPPAVCYDMTPASGERGATRARETDAAATVTTQLAKKNDHGTRTVQRSSVRRLTPEECERLQGLPTGYTKIPGHDADGPRYFVLGNSIAIPDLTWIGERIDLVDRIPYSAAPGEEHNR